MNSIVTFVLGAFFGGAFGIAFMCLFQINSGVSEDDGGMSNSDVTCEKGDLP